MLKLTTFSIAARCSRTGQLGVAVSTKVPGVGGICPFIAPGVGAVATQAWVNPYIGVRVLAALQKGMPAAEALQTVMVDEIDRELRQVGVVDARGRSESFTGKSTDPWTGHRNGPEYAIQGNMLVGEDTVLAMERAFLDAAAEPLGERLMLAIEAGQHAGGDKRGRQSASVKVFADEDYPIVDLRADEHPDPVAELRRIFEVAKRELFPFIDVLPTKKNPKGNLDSIRAAMGPKD
ncbi:MAG: DUF1028 domain-containing protein [Candidatus Binatia bacterium]